MPKRFSSFKILFLLLSPHFLFLKFFKMYINQKCIITISFESKTFQPFIKILYLNMIYMRIILSIIIHYGLYICIYILNRDHHNARSKSTFNSYDYEIVIFFINGNSVCVRNFAHIRVLW